MIKWVSILLAVTTLSACNNQASERPVMETIRIVEEYYPDTDRDTVGTPVPDVSDGQNAVGEVFICTGKGAKTYHKSKSCQGLSQCKKEIRRINVSRATKMGRRACKRCAVS